MLQVKTIYQIAGWWEEQQESEFCLLNFAIN